VVALVPPVHDEVDGALLEQEFTALEAFRKGLAHGLGDHAGTGEADQRARLADVYVAQHRKAGRYATRGGIGQHRDIRQVGFCQSRQRGTGLGHLHQRQQRLLHAGAARGREAHQWRAIRNATLHGAMEAFTHHRAHGTAQETELECTGHHLLAVQPPGKGDQRIFFAGGFLRGGQAVLVALAVLESQWILGLHIGADLIHRTRVEEAIKSRPGMHAHVMAALGADMKVALELGAIKHRIAGRALDPQTLGNRAHALFGLDARGNDLFEPGHDVRPTYP
jgi:hypothetical protein